MSSQSKEDLCQQLLAWRRNGELQPTLDHALLTKLERHCKRNQQPSDDEVEVLGIIRHLLAETGDASNMHSSTSTESQDDQEQWFMVATSCDDIAPLQQSSSPLETGLGDVASVGISFQPGSNVAAISETTVTLPFRATPLVPQPSQFSDKYKNMQTLSNYTREYYSYRLHVYSFHFKGYYGGSQESTLELNDGYDNLVQTKTFWTKIKNVFYFLKMGEEGLWEPELAEASEMIPVLCEKPSLTLLKDMYGTLSPTATNIRSSVRFTIFRSFEGCAESKLGFDHIFTKICRILSRYDGDDELSMTLLQVMLDETKRILPEHHLEIFELERTLIRLFRRNQEFQKAEDLFWMSVRTTQDLHGPNHVNSRLAWTEYLYIRQSQGRYEEALDVAFKILERGQANQDEPNPNVRSIYAMEDIAALCEKLGRVNDAIMWLRRALGDAISIQSDSRSASHIFSKLQALEDKRCQEVSGLVAPNSS